MYYCKHGNKVGGMGIDWMCPQCEDGTEPEVFFDYEKQTWVEDGRYVRCGHPENMQCSCYGRLHEGEQA